MISSRCSLIRYISRLASLLLEFAEDLVEDTFLAFLALKDGQCEHRAQADQDAGAKCITTLVAYAHADAHHTEKAENDEQCCCGSSH